MRRILNTLFSCLLLLSTTFTSQAQTQLGQDILGQAASDYFGSAISISSDGSRMVVGAYFHDNDDKGTVQVYEWNSNTSQWVQMGSDIDGNGANQLFGRSVAISPDGSRIAAGATNNRVKIYEWNGTAWTQVAGDITGTGDFGFSISLSDDDKIAIGARLGNYAEVYELVNNAWVKVGQTLNGEVTNNQFGYSISISKDGQRLAVGAPHNSANATYAGHVRVFEWNSGTSQWVQIGADLDGDAVADGLMGSDVSLSADGSRVIIGAQFLDVDLNADGFLEDKVGQAKVYEWGGSSWTQVGSDFYGEVAKDLLGSHISISEDGNRVALRYQNVSSSNAAIFHGRVRLFEWDGSSWTQVGNLIDGSSGEKFGHDMYLSGDGTVIAAGSYSNTNVNGIGAGKASAYYMAPTTTTVSLGLTSSCADATSWSIPIQLDVDATLGAVSFVLDYDESALTYTGFTSATYGTMVTDGLINDDGDKLSFSWIASGSSGVSYTANTDLLVLNFTPNTSGAAASPAFTWSTTLSDCELSDNTASLISTTFNDATGTINATPTAGLTSDATNNTTLCIGDNVTFTATGGTSYSFDVNGGAAVAGTGTGNAQFSSASLANGDIVTVTVTDGNGCSSTENLTMVVNALPTAGLTSDATNNTTLCIGDNVTFTATGGTSYSFDVNGGAAVAGAGTGNAEFSSASLANGDIVTVTVTDGNGCSSTASLTMVVNALPTPTLTSDKTNNEICAGETITFIGAGAGGTGNALDFDGNNNFVTMGDVLSKDRTDAYTLEAWIKTGFTGEGAIINKMTAVGSHGYQFKISANGKLSLEIYNTYISNGISVITNNSYNDATWKHVAVTYDGSSNASGVTIYVDGSAVASTVLQDNLSSSPISSAPLSIGAKNNTNSFFQGSIDEVRIWNYARSASDISNNKDNELAGSENGLEAYYDFNGGVAGGSNTGVTTLIDRTGNGFDGTVTNFVLTGNTSNFVGGAVAGSGTYQFFVNNVSQGAASSTNTFSSAALSNNNVVKVTVTNSNGCSADATVTVTVNPLPTAGLTSDATNNTTLCIGDNVTFTATGGTSYSFDVNGGAAVVGTGTGNAQFSSASLANGDIVTVTVTDGNGCSSTENLTMVVNPLPTPTLASSDADNKICTGSSITFTAGNADEYIFQVNGSTVQAQSATATYTTSALANNDVVSVIGVNTTTGCQGTSATTFAMTVINCYSYSGKVVYKNTAETYMGNVDLTLTRTSDNVTFTTTTSLVDGTFSIPNLFDGETYTMSYVTGKTTGGINSTDALKNILHTVGANTITGLYLLAADVNGNGTPNATDALEIRRRFVGLTNTFPAGDWLFDNVSFTLSGGNVSNQTIYSLVYGDVNGSFVPNSTESENPTVFFIDGDEMTISNGDNISIPIRADINMNVGAISLVIYHQGMTINNITLSNGQNVLFNNNNGVLKISYADLAGMALSSNDVLFNINATVIDADIIINNPIELGVKSEIANNTAVSYSFVELKLPVFKTITTNINNVAVGKLGLNAFPNPFMEKATISYNLPTSSKVIITITNALGQQVRTLVNENQDAGAHQVEFIAAELPVGVYSYTIQVKDKEADYQVTNQLIIIE